LKAKDVRAVDDAGNLADTTDLDDDIPDMEDEDDDDAIIRDPSAESKSGLVSPPGHDKSYIRSTDV
jgi:ubiquitin-like-conjugating enzyme ATG3